MNEELYLCFDIETIPLPWESFSESQQEFLLRRAETEADQDQRKAEMALSPMTAQAVCIGLQLMRKADDNSWEMIKKAAFSCDSSLTGENSSTLTLSTGDPCFLSSEEKLIQDFWRILKKYNNATLVSFNGRGFDAPFLMLRSAIKKIRPSRNLMAGTKFNYPQHVDLIDELTFYNPSSIGATKRFNFDFYARAFGLTSPKSEGIDGSKVNEFYQQGRIAEIAEYCMRDVATTWKLFLIWKEFLSWK